MPSVRLIFLLTLTAFSSATPIAHIFLIIGQSNAVGLNSDGHTSEDVTYDNIVQTSCCEYGIANNDKCKLISAQDPLHHQCDLFYLNSQSVAFGMSFARQFRENIPEDDVVVLVPAAIGGSGFVDYVWPAYTGTGFKKALKRLQRTFVIVAKQYPNHTVSLDGFLWHQGERDAQVYTTTAEYLNDDIIPMINAWRNSTLIPQSSTTVPFIVGNFVPEWVEDPNHTERLGVSVALQTLDQYIPYSFCVSSQGLVGDTNLLIGNIHFSAQSQRIFGKRYYAGLKMALSNNSP